MIVLHGAFDCAEAHRVLELVAAIPSSARVQVDFHDVQLIDDFAFASFAGEMAPEHRPAVELVGVSRHLDRLMHYLGPHPVIH